jgi:hypothetical protein
MACARWGSTPLAKIICRYSAERMRRQYSPSTSRVAASNGGWPTHVSQLLPHGGQNLCEPRPSVWPSLPAAASVTATAYFSVLNCSLCSRRIRALESAYFVVHSGTKSVSPPASSDTAARDPGLIARVCLYVRFASQPPQSPAGALVSGIECSAGMPFSFSSLRGGTKSGCRLAASSRQSACALCSLRDRALWSGSSFGPTYFVVTRDRKACPLPASSARRRRDPGFDCSLCLIARSAFAMRDRALEFGDSSFDYGPLELALWFAQTRWLGQFSLSRRQSPSGAGGRPARFAPRAQDAHDRGNSRRSFAGSV